MNVASKNGICGLRFRFWEGSLHEFLVSSLKVLCIVCKFLASSLQVICKILAKLLAKALQEFSAGGGKRGKVETTMVPTSILNDPSLVQGVGQGYPEINRKITNMKTQTQTQKLEIFFHLRRFPQTTEGSTTGCLPMFYEKKKSHKHIV